MEFEWDEAKNRSNLVKHGVGFELVEIFDWENAGLREDKRRDYREARILAYGPASDGKHYVIAFTMQNDRCRIISVRPFGRKDDQFYEPPNSRR